MDSVIYINLTPMESWEMRKLPTGWSHLLCINSVCKLSGFIKVNVFVPTSEVNKDNKKGVNFGAWIVDFLGGLRNLMKNKNRLKTFGVSSALLASKESQKPPEFAPPTTSALSLGPYNTKSELTLRVLVSKVDTHELIQMR